MYVPIPTQATNVQAWLAAASAVESLGGRAHNVVIDIADPLGKGLADAALIHEIDTFLKNHNRYPLSTVANTIFPQSLNDRYGSEEFYSVYRETVLPRMKRMTGDWGRYFDRLTAWKKLDGSNVLEINPLDDLVKFMRRQVTSKGTHRNTYEMTIFDPTRDADKVSNRQCLSFLSFKLTKDKKLMLTAIYRNHSYIARGLGNFIGLGRLMAFVSREAGVGLGSLTCISTHAEIDHGRKRNKKTGKVEGWTGAEAKTLLERCRQINGSN